MAELTDRVVTTGHIRIHLVEAGAGPTVLLIHGFPESWYSWRHQLPALDAAGYRAVAIDVRGYGRSSAPNAVEDYRMMCYVADNVAVLDGLGVDTAVIVGHDWGAPIAWHTVLLRPDRFPALGLLSVPYSPRGTTRPTDVFRSIGGDEEFYISYFQCPGRAEAEIEPDVRSWLTGFYFTASGDAPRPTGGTMATIRPGGQLRDRLVVPERLPAWLTEADLDFYVAEFERTGLTGGLNRYRNVDRDWEDFGAFTHTPIRVPSLFIGGQYDGPTVWGARAIARFDETLPNLWGSFLIDGCGHWVQQERPQEVNRHLIDFLAAVGR